VANAALSRQMVPVFWDTGNDISRNAPYAASPDLAEAMRNINVKPAP